MGLLETKSLFKWLGVALVLLLWGIITKDMKPFFVYAAVFTLVFAFEAVNVVMGNLNK